MMMMMMMISVIKVITVELLTHLGRWWLSYMTCVVYNNYQATPLCSTTPSYIGPTPFSPLCRDSGEADTFFCPPPLYSGHTL